MCRGILVGLLLLVVATSAEAYYDQPISGAKLYIKSVGNGQQLQFQSKDWAFLFPAPGSIDDPTSHFTSIEILSAVEPTATIVIPGGFGKPGWNLHDWQKNRLVFANSHAPDGISVVKKFSMKPGKLLQLMARAPGLTLPSATTRVAIRITTGGIRNCAVFEGASILKNEPGKFLAKNAAAPAIADCSDASLLHLPCGWGPPDYNPICGGECPPGETCETTGFPAEVGCGCIPVGTIPCGYDGGVPTCGGTCPAGFSCGAMGVYECLCLGDACPNGFAFDPPDGCLPVPCGGGDTYPTCSENACGDGGVCTAYSSDAPLDTCLCAVPGPCGAGGYDCPVGEVCHVSGASATCGPP